MPIDSRSDLLGVVEQELATGVFRSILKYDYNCAYFFGLRLLNRLQTLSDIVIIQCVCYCMFHVETYLL